MAICVALCALASAVPAAAAATYVSFDPPESILTGARGINNEGYVTGGFDVTGGDRICYFRDSEGDFHTFTDQAGDPQCGGASINSKGLITGQVGSKNAQCKNAGQYNGFVRAPDGTVTTFDPDGSVDTQGLGINLSGQIAGFYLDSSCVFHGFLRSSTGQFTILDVQKNALPYYGTTAKDINKGGEVTGYFINADGVESGFYYFNKQGGRSCAKGCQPFRVPGANGTDKGSGMAINDSGMITGSYTDSKGAYHGFIRSSGGTFTKLNAPGAGKGSGQGTFPVSINKGGAISGKVIDNSNSKNDTHGFVCSAEGKCTTFDVNLPDVLPGTTIAYAINDKDQITGVYKDTSDVQHGFLRSP